MSVGSSSTTPAPEGARAVSPPTTAADLKKLFVASVVGSSVNGALLLLICLMLLMRGCGGEASSPARSTGKRLDDVTLKEVRELTGEYTKALETLSPFFNERLKPLQDDLRKQRELLQKIAEKVKAE